MNVYPAINISCYTTIMDSPTSYAINPPKRRSLSSITVMILSIIFVVLLAGTGIFGYYAYQLMHSTSASEVNQVVVPQTQIHKSVPYVPPLTLPDPQHH